MKIQALTAPGNPAPAAARIPGPLLAGIAGLVLLAAGTAGAAEPAQAHFQDEVRRCVMELRPTLDGTNVHQYRFEVTRVDRTAGWYVFRIRTTARDAAGNVLGEPRQSRCAASRWNHRVAVEATDTGGSPAALFQAARARPGAPVTGSRIVARQ